MAKKKKKIGRPEGAKTHRPKGLEVRQTDSLDRANAVNRRPGYRRVVLETLDPEYALQLRTLVRKIRARDKTLFKLLVEKKK